MTFNSVPFLIFATVFFLFWWMLRRWQTPRWVFLTFASFFFYGWWDWRFIGLIVASGLVDYVAGLFMQSYPRWKKSALTLSILTNLGILGTFKYADFFISSANEVFAGYLSAPFPLMELTLPVGISFYTFQSMSYTIDIYRGSLKPTKNIFHFFAYLSMFPQLVAGPIIRASDLLPQLETARPITNEDRWVGLQYVTRGFFKKVVIADNLAPFVANAFGLGEINSSPMFWWLTMTMFAFQIYCDFSGYSDIAIGLAKWMGYDFRENFKHPYISSSIREFWTRWHISLSTWFRDYVYIPLGGSKRGSLVGHRNMWITMLISGLWHGASWTFVIWGAAHAAFLFIERVTKWPELLARIPGGKILSAVIVFGLVLLSWVFFRAESFGQAVAIIGVMLGLATGTTGEWGREDLELFPNIEIILAALAVIILREIYCFLDLHDWIPKWGWLKRLHFYLEPVMMVGMLLACVYFRGPGSVFIYFQF